MATRDGRTYAVLGVNAANGNGVTTLVASDDHLRTWRTLAGSLAPAASGDLNYRGLWVNPATGTILVEPLFGGEVWSTADEGQHWTQLPWPTVGVVDFPVQQPEAVGPWHICAAYRFQSLVLSSTVLIISPHLVPASFLTDAPVGAILVRGWRRQDVLGSKTLCTWTPATVGRVLRAQCSPWAKSFALSSPLVSGGPARSGAGVTHRLAVVQPPAQLLPSTGGGQRVKRVRTSCSTITLPPPTRTARLPARKTTARLGRNFRT
jgi:hypothetical protein